MSQVPALNLSGPLRHRHFLQSGVITSLIPVYYTLARLSRNNLLNRTDQSAWIFCTCVLSYGDVVSNYNYGHHHSYVCQSEWSQKWK